MTQSLRLRTVALLLAALLPIAIASGFALVELFGDRLLRDIDVALEEEADTLAALASGDSRGESLDPVVARVAAEADLGTPKYAIVRRGSEIVAESPEGAGEILSRRQRAVRVARARRGPIEVTVGVNAHAAVRAKKRLTVLVSTGLPIVVLLIGASVWIVAGRALRPLELAAAELPRVGARNLSVRVPVVNPDDEVGRMARALNSMLDRLETSVGDLHRVIADGAHELRTPLSVLRTVLEVALRKDATAEEYRADLAEALATTDRLCRLTDDLLLLARLESDVAQPKTEKVDVLEMLSEIAEVWRAAPGEKENAIEVIGQGGPLLAEGRPGDLYRLFGNLVENAVHHGGGGHIELRGSRIANRLEVSVRDEGPGIDPREQERIFERFHRLGSKRGGSGLGLSIAREIARRHGGDVTVDGAPGRGALFRVTLPACAESVTPA
jgi:signal transduction histidine kinase